MIAIAVGESTVWMDYAMWQFEKKWLEDRERAFWREGYNRHMRAEYPMLPKDCIEPGIHKAITNAPINNETITIQDPDLRAIRTVVQVPDL